MKGFSTVLTKEEVEQLLNSNTDNLIRDNFSSPFHPDYGKDLIGKTFGDLTVIGYGEKYDRDNKRLYTCKCICSEITYATRYQLISGEKKRCNKCRIERLIKLNEDSSIIPDEEFIGNTYNKITVIGKSDIKNSQGKTLYDCYCACSPDIIRRYKKFDIVTGNIKSCGCLLADIIDKKNKEFEESMIGKQYGYLTIIKRADKQDTNHNSRWLCQCDCGVKIIKFKSELDKKDRVHPLSCGCMNPYKQYAFGEDEQRLRSIYLGMRSRCLRKENASFKNYGGRGISICKEWMMNPRKFFEWAFDNGYRPDLTIDRVDVDKDYSPENCAWKTFHEQQYNKQNSIRFSDGSSFKEFCDKNKFNYKKLIYHYRNDIPNYTVDEFYNLIANDPRFITI